MASQTLTSGERCTCRAPGWVDSVGFKGKNSPHCPNIAENQESWAVFDNYLQSSKRRSMFNTAITNPFSVPFSTTGCVLIVTPTSWHLGQKRWNPFQSEPICCLPQVPLILLGGLALGYHNSCAAMVGDMDRLVTQWILTAPKQCIEVMVVTSNPCLIYTTWNGPNLFNISSWRS